MKPVEGRKRIMIEYVEPQVGCGRYPAKRIIGDTVTVTAAIFADGHDHISGRLLFRHEKDRTWSSTAITPLTNDLWSASFLVDKPGTWNYTIEAWIDHFGTWHADLKKRLAAQHDPAADAASASQNIPLALRTGAILLGEAA
ncbi:MAG: maltotransferase domain-containing protein, partial [Edaphobacter sp.]